MLIQKFIYFLKNNNPELDESLQVVEEINNKHNGLLSKFILFFFFWFVLILFIFLLMGAITSIFFILAGEVPVEIKNYFILGGFVTAVMSYGSFKLMKKLWRKLRQPIKKELKLEL
ncbi:MAG: hypothetical protein OEW99_08610 [Gammaproteobacteria bacterium]|nr:hypothetical protein [Gammaproteobacteria bacterium]